MCGAGCSLAASRNSPDGYRLLAGRWLEVPCVLSLRCVLRLGWHEVAAGHCASYASLGGWKQGLMVPCFGIVRCLGEPP